MSDENKVANDQKLALDLHEVRNDETVSFLLEELTTSPLTQLNVNELVGRIVQIANRHIWEFMLEALQVPDTDPATQWCDQCSNQDYAEIIDGHYYCADCAEKYYHNLDTEPDTDEWRRKYAIDKEPDTLDKHGDWIVRPRGSLKELGRYGTYASARKAAKNAIDTEPATDVTPEQGKHSVVKVHDEYAVATIDKHGDFCYRAPPVYKFPYTIHEQWARLHATEAEAQAEADRLNEAGA